MKHPTLIQRLWLLLLLLVFLAFSGTLLANLMNARSYLEQQLTEQNANTANSLALMVSQQRAEPVMAETLISATFDQGHYRLIRWQGSTGQVRVERQRSTQEPGWLPRLLELRAPQVHRHRLRLIRLPPRVLLAPQPPQLGRLARPRRPDKQDVVTPGTRDF